MCVLCIGVVYIELGVLWCVWCSVVCVRLIKLYVSVSVFRLKLVII